MSQCIAQLKDGWLGNLSTLGGLQTMAGLTDQKAAELCGVAAGTYRRWRTDRRPPLYAFRLLAVQAGYVPWSGWEKWFYNPFDQTLVLVDLKDGFSPAKVAEFLFMRQLFRHHLLWVNLYIDKPKGEPPLRGGLPFADGAPFSPDPGLTGDIPLPYQGTPCPGLGTPPPVYQENGCAPSKRPRNLTQVQRRTVSPYENMGKF